MRTILLAALLFMAPAMAEPLTAKSLNADDFKMLGWRDKLQFDGDLLDGVNGTSLLLKQYGVMNLSELAGKPVIVELDKSNRLTSWHYPEDAA